MYNLSTNLTTEMITEERFNLIKTLLPESYKIAELGYRKGSFRCTSLTGIDNEREWFLIFQGIRAKFAGTFMEIDHNTCHNHKDFIIYFKKYSDV